MKKTIILFFCMIFVKINLSAQQNPPKPVTAEHFIKNYFYRPFPLIPQNNHIILPAPDFYVKNLGFFCKQELKVQSVTRVPLKLRLGSVQYCDWMEGKRNAGILPGN
jgi:hypothetical protein